MDDAMMTAVAVVGGGCGRGGHVCSALSSQEAVTCGASAGVKSSEVSCDWRFGVEGSEDRD